MQRMVVVGAPGSGKTTLAQQLAAHFGCAFVDLDTLFWDPGWTQVPREVFRVRVADALQPECWATGGNYSTARDLIWGRADTVIWLDYPLTIVLWRLVCRTIRRIAMREVLWSGNRETWRKAFASRDSLILYVITSHARRRRNFPSEFAKPEYAHIATHRFRHPAEAQRWLAQVTCQ
jgi:adenylate kinase family enzyme